MEDNKLTPDGLIFARILENNTVLYAVYDDPTTALIPDDFQV